MSGRHANGRHLQRLDPDLVGTICCGLLVLGFLGLLAVYLTMP